MANFMKHIPGSNPIETPTRHAASKGVGVLGLHEGRTLLLALQTRCSKAHAVAGCDLSAEKIGAARGEYPELFYTSDYAALLARDDVEIVAIYTPDALHGEHIVQAFEAGKDVICTKPMVNSLADARLVWETGLRTGRRLLVGQSTRFFEPFRRQRRAFEAGEVGAVEMVDAHYVHRMDWYYEKSAWAARETDWIFLGLSHPLDLLRWYLGPIAEVSAFGQTSALGRKYELAHPDIYVVNVVAADGRVGRAFGHYGAHELPRARNCIELMLYGDQGTSQAQYHDMRYVHTTADGTEVVEDHLYAGRHYYFNSEVHGMHYGEFANYAEYFAGVLIAGDDDAEYSPNLREGIETFCLMEAARLSVAEKRMVAVGELMSVVGLEV